jgi:hypothetical protein
LSHFYGRYTGTHLNGFRKQLSVNSEKFNQTRHEKRFIFSILERSYNSEVDIES